MPRETQFKITGGPEIQKALKELPKKLQRRALVHAFRTGAKIVKDDAALRALKVSPDFASSLVVARPNKKRRANNEVVVVIAHKRSHSRLAHIFEFGTANRYQKNGRFTGRIIATPYLRPALDARSNEAIQSIASILKENVEIIARQLSAGQKVSLRRSKR